MLANAKLRKKIVSNDGEIIGYAQEFYPLKVIQDSNAKYESTQILEGIKNNKFSSVITTRSTLLDNFADKIEVGDKIELLFTKNSFLVAYKELSNKNYGKNVKVYYIGLE